MDVDGVAKALGLGPRYDPWLRALDEVEPLPAFALPSGEAAAELLVRLGVPEVDVEPVLSVWPDPARDVELWWLLERCHARFVSHMGDGDAFVECPSLPRELDLQGRCFWIFVFASMVDATRAYHRERGVPDDVSWATLADLGQQLVVHRNRRGTTGLDLQWWLVAHFLGALTRSAVCSSTCTTCDAASRGPRSGPRATSPGSARATRRWGCTSPRPAHSPLPRATNRSTLATSFVGDHFPEHDFRVATCTSWLLDEQLADYLRADSNIVQFQRRFHVVDGASDDGRDIMLLRVRPRSRVDRRAAPAHDTRAGDRAAPARRRPLAHPDGLARPPPVTAAAQRRIDTGSEYGSST